LNCTPIVRQYGILNNDWGVFMPKGVPNKRYTAEFKQKVVEAVLNEGLSYEEARRIYEVNGRDRIQSWERIYLAEGPEGLAVERRGRGSTGRPKKLPRTVEEDLLAEVQRLRAETLSIPDS
jgi:transposase